MSYRSNSTGFTLIELLIIVVLLAIMASFAI
ncbi:prepilin-type N-terminal cleavage/methylation domain-containing protein, partial [Pseudomonas aeruginosa]